MLLRLVLQLLLPNAAVDAEAQEAHRDGGLEASGSSGGLPVRRLGATDLWRPTVMLYHRGKEPEDVFGYIGFAAGGSAAVSLLTGKLLWAHEPLQSTGAIQAMNLKGGVLVSTSESGRVQAWDAHDGHLKWVRDCPGGVARRVMNVGGGDDGFAFACASEVEARSREGATAWVHPAPVGMQIKAASSVDQGHNICFLAEGAGVGAGAVAVKVDGYTGAALSSTAVPEAVARGLAAGSFVTTGGRLVWPTPGQVHSYSLCGDGDVLSADSVAADERATLAIVQDTPRFFSITNDVVTGIFYTDAGSLRRFRLVDGPAIIGPVLGAMYGEAGRWIAVMTREQGGCRVQIVNTRHGGDEADAVVSGAYDVGAYGVGEKVVAHERYDGSFRAFVATSGKHSLLAIQGRAIHWVRNGFDDASSLVQVEL